VKRGLRRGAGLSTGKGKKETHRGKGRRGGYGENTFHAWAKSPKKKHKERKEKHGTSGVKKHKPMPP